MAMLFTHHNLREFVRMKLHFIAVALIAFAASQAALAETVVVSGTAEGASRNDAVTKAQATLESNCSKNYKGQPVAGSFKVTFEKPLSNGKHYVDATMSCNTP